MRTMNQLFEAWLRQRGFDKRTVASRISEIRRVEEHYGNLVEHFHVDRLESILQNLHYSASDERHGRSNPTSIPIIGVLRTNLASYRSAISRYREFLEAGQAEDTAASTAGSRRSLRPYLDPSTGDSKTLADFGLDGLSSFRAIIEGSQYATMTQAIASLTLFTHPDTARQTGGRAIFFAIRDPRRVGEIAEVGGRRVALDDNRSATNAFLWANRLPRRGRDTQFNHVYASSGDVDAYTALPNICMTPAFLAKLTDTSPDIRNLLRFRSFDLYGWHPAGEPAPQRPDGYDSLEWAPPLAPVPDVRRAIEEAMARKPKDRTVRSAKELGWLFDQRQPSP